METPGLFFQAFGSAQQFLWCHGDRKSTVLRFVIVTHVVGVNW
ncbi:hypothetical protein [Roseovarius indicus]